MGRAPVRSVRSQNAESTAWICTHHAPPLTAVLLQVSTPAESLETSPYHTVLLLCFSVSATTPLRVRTVLQERPLPLSSRLPPFDKELGTCRGSILDPRISELPSPPRTRAPTLLASQDHHTSTTTLLAPIFFPSHLSPQLIIHSRKPQRPYEPFSSLILV